MALSGVLVSPRVPVPRRARSRRPRAADTPYRVSDLELASRLSFFLWSSIPDDELLDGGDGGQASPAGGARAAGAAHARRPRSRALVTNFAAQWLHLRNLDSITPDMRLFPDFDDNLRQAFRQETELFFESVLREDRSVLDLLKRGPHVPERAAGEALRHPARVRQRASGASTLDDDSWRGGLLRQGSILTVTSYATRTSPVIRGKWVLDNLLGVPPPPPPPERAGAQGQHGRRQPVGPRAARRAPEQRGVRAAATT